jgi:hypothetical protein
MASDQPVCVVEYNVYKYERVSETLPTGKTEKVLRQTELVSTVDILDVERVTVTQNMGSGADDFSIELNNEGGQYTDRFLPFQEIVVYIGFPNDINNIKKGELAKVIVGLIDDAEPTYSKSNGSKLMLNGRNYAALLLDNKVTDNFKKMTATQIVETLVKKYGLGLDATISKTKVVYNKTIRTNNPNALQAMVGKPGMDANFEQTPEIKSAIDLFNPRAATAPGPDDSVFKNKSAWEVIEALAYMEASVDPESENRELISYFDGKVFYFGPRRNVETDPTKMFQLTVGENVEAYTFRMSSQFIHTRIRMVTRKMKNFQVQKEPYVVLIPDDLKAPSDLSESELSTFLAFQGVYGIREMSILDRDQQWGGDIKKLKRVGIAKLKEFTRLAFTGDIKFVYVTANGNSAISLLNKDRAVFINGIPAVDGLPNAEFDEAQSERFNGIFYIEKCVHNFTKGEGYKVNLSVSSRKPERSRALSNLTITPSNIVTRKTTTTQVEDPYDKDESLLKD